MKHALLLLVPALLSCGAAHAAGPLRCDGKLIRPGVSAAYVLEKCGPPDFSVTEQAPRRARTVTGFSRLAGISVSDQWIYNRGTGKFPAVLIIRDGRLIRIDYLPERS